MMETQEVQKSFTKLSPGNICRLSYLFSYACETCALLNIYLWILCFIKQASYCIRMLISLVKVLIKIPKIIFQWGSREVLRRSIMYIHCSIREGEPGQNRLVVDVRDFTPSVVMMLIVFFQKLTSFLNFEIFDHFSLKVSATRKILNNKIASFSLRQFFFEFLFYKMFPHWWEHSHFPNINLKISIHQWVFSDIEMNSSLLHYL